MPKYGLKRYGDDIFRIASQLSQFVRDGDLDDDTITNPTLACSRGIISECAVQNQYLINLPVGLNQLTTPAFLSWHSDTGTKQVWIRITLSKKPWTGGSAPGVRGNGGS